MESGAHSGIYAVPDYASLHPGYIWLLLARIKMMRTVMKPRLRLEVCAFFADEFRAALAAEGRDDVEVVPVHGACDERHHPAHTQALPTQSETQTLRLMGVCSGGAACPNTPHSCFELLLGPGKVEALLNEGAHLLTPAMVRAYPETLQSLNEKPENLHTYFAESVRAWVVVDTGVAPLTAAEQAAFLAATGGTIELLPTELHLLRANLRAALAQGEAAAIEARSAKQIALLQHRLADYTMAYDLISRLIPYQGEQTIIQAILELFYMLCAPRAVHLLLVQDGGKDGDVNIAEESVQLFSLPAASGKEDLLRTFLHCTAPWGEVEAPQGFYFQIHQEDVKTLGAVVVEGAFLPEHQRNYLDIAHLLMPILRLALHNARSYERLCNTERELRASQMELEQRVEERTAQLTAEIAVRKHSEQALREAEARFRSSFEAAAIGMALVSTGGRFVDANSALCQLVGYSHEELLQKTFQEITHPDDLDVDLNYAKQLVADERASYQMEKRYFHKDGHIVWVLLTGSTVRDEQGNLLYFIAQVQDITERKQAEAALKRHKTVIDTAQDGFWMYDTSGYLLEVNQAYADMMGYTREELTGMHISQLSVLSNTPELVKARMEKIITQGSSSHFETQHRHKDGHIVHFETSNTFMPESNLIFSFLRDITKRKEYEEELKRSNTELEQFSYAVSHDMRQPLRMISSYLQLIEISLGGQLDGEKRDYFNFAIEGAKRIDQMLVALLEYSRVGRMGEPPTWIESQAVLDEALQFLLPAIIEAQANLNISGDWPRILASHDEILRLLQNLIGNAAKFRVAERAPEITVTSKVVKNEWHLSVADNGVGIIPDQIKRLFQVFQRLQLRTAYEGNGVGLALCRKIAEHHKGRVWAESAGEGQGSKFCVVLPVLRDETLSAREKSHE